MRVFVVGMPGAGNLGDDLISVMLVQHIFGRWPDAEIGILHAGHPIPFTYPKQSQIRFFEMPQRRSWSKWIGRNRDIIQFIRAADLVLVGGGGLFQDSHSYFTVHKWMRYVLYTSPYRAASATIGVGFGPFNYRFSLWYLARTLGRFSVIQVRDQGSSDIVRSLGYVSQIAPDVVAGTPLMNTVFAKKSDITPHPTLGCSIRPWPGLKFDALVGMIQRISHTQQMGVRLFVFEYAEPHNISELCYAVKVARALRERQIDVEVFCYGKDPLEVFVGAFCSVTKAIATRFHANILWQKLGVLVLPLSYAPKVERLYEERGGQVIHIDSISGDITDDWFQKIELEEPFVLPSSNELFGATNYGSVQGVFLALAVDVLESVYGLVNSLSWRLKKLW